MRRFLILLNITLIISSFLFCQDLEDLLNQANTKLKIGELKSAESLLQQALDIDPSFAPARVGFSKLWLRRGDLVKANEYATLAVLIDEDFRPWWDELNYIRTKVQLGRQKTQKADYENKYLDFSSIIKNPFKYLFKSVIESNNPIIKKIIAIEITWV